MIYSMIWRHTDGKLNSLMNQGGFFHHRFESLIEERVKKEKKREKIAKNKGLKLDFFVFVCFLDNIGLQCEKTPKSSILKVKCPINPVNKRSNQTN